MKHQEIYSSDQDIDLKELSILFWQKKKFILWVTIISFVSSVALALILPQLFQSSATLKIITTSSQAQSSNSGSMGKLQSSASIFLGGGSASSDYVLAEKTILSRDFFRHLISFDGVLAKLKYFDKYDGKTGKLIFSDNIYNPKTSEWLISHNPEDEEDTSYLEAYRTYKSLISISWQKDSSDFLVISMTHASPYFAKEFLSLVIAETNSLVRGRKFAETSKSIDFLNKKLLTTPTAEVRASINQIIRNQLNTQMVAAVRKDYLLSPLDKPFIADIRTSPRRTLIVILFTSLGLIFSMISVTIYHYNFESNRFKK